MVLIKGWQKTSLIDYSPYTTSVIFVGGCSFKCGYCHNPELVLGYSDIPSIKLKEILDYLEKKKMWIDGVCITGGEPTVYKELPKLISRIKQIGVMIKLDTNGSNPEMIEKLVRKKLVDYFAMDIKTNLDKYEDVVGVKVDKEKIQQSIDLIKKSGVKYEFRTTVVPSLVGKKEIFLIGKWLKGADKFVIQNFRKTRPLINNELREIEGYSKEDLEEMKNIASEYFKKVELRD